MQLEKLAFELGNFVLGAVGLVQILLELAAQTFAGFAFFKKFVGNICGSENGGIRAPDLCAGEQLLHLAVDVGADFLHIGGGFLCDKGVLLAADVHGDTISHNFPILSSVLSMGKLHPISYMIV